MDPIKPFENLNWGELTIHGDELEKAISLEFVDDDDITFYVKLASSRRRHKQNESQAKSHPLNLMRLG